MRGTLLLASLLVTVAFGATAQEAQTAAAPAGRGVQVFATGPTPDRINRACGEDPSCRGRGDNRNYYDLTRINQQVTAAECNHDEFVRRHGHEPCPSDMVWVCSANWQVNICMDRDLRKEASGRYMGNVGRQECKAWCESRGRRLPSNNEWMVACEGTQPTQCLRPAITHPIMQRLRGPAPWVYNEVNCKVGGNAWRSCMQDLSLNDRVRDARSGATSGVPSTAETQRCVSSYGARNMVAVLGQWVADTYGSRGQFNGGLYPQPASSCNYTTVAHPSDYSDYSIGCRCSGAIDTSLRAINVKATKKPPAKRKQPQKTPAPRPTRTA